MSEKYQLSRYSPDRPYEEKKHGLHQTLEDAKMEAQQRERKKITWSTGRGIAAAHGKVGSGSHHDTTTYAVYKSHDPYYASSKKNIGGKE